MKEDILNYSPTASFVGHPVCSQSQRDYILLGRRGGGTDYSSP